MTVRRPLAIALSASVALAGLVTVSATGASGAPPTNVQPRAAVSNTTAWAAIKTISLPVSGNPDADIAVNSADDTVYVVATDDDSFLVINGQSGTLTDVSFTLDDPTSVVVDQDDDTVYTVTRTEVPANSKVQSWSASPMTLGSNEPIPHAFNLAVDSADDTVYVARNSGPRLSYFSGRTPLNDDSVNVGGNAVYGIAVDQSDDSVWMALSVDDSVRAWNGRTNVLGSFVGGVGNQPNAVAVDETDDTVYVADSLSPFKMAVINGRTSSVVGTAIEGPFQVTTSNGLAVDDSNNRLFVASGGSTLTFGVINEANTDDSFYLSAPSFAGSAGAPLGNAFYAALTVDDSGSNHGLVWAAAPLAARVQALAQVSPSLTGTTTGAVGATVTVSVTSTPTVAFDFDDIAVKAVRFNGATPGTNLAAGAGNTWTVKLPSGLPAGQVSVEVQFNGLQYALAGTYTVQSSPTPDPVYPPGAPTDVVATAGVGGASVSWTAPTYVGSYPITDYQVTSSPGAKSCLVKAPATSCAVTGLTNGTSYTFRARALNGADWGSYSEPSNAVTPVKPSIVITGSRDPDKVSRIRVTATTTGLVGEQVRPYLRFPGDSSFSPGEGVRTVREDGTFVWSRKMRLKTRVYFAHGSVTSNTVVIPAR